ncbi:MAG TPA: TIM-barrel domain-containing protein [Candidatus Didemnitutus sp.]|nr:TIM-barrel domain-containing protein [Candidatus Didemnitutus sp.]
MPLRFAPFAAALLLPVLLVAAAPEKVPDGIVVSRRGGFLKIGVCADDTVRVAFAANRDFFDRPSLIVLPSSGSKPTWTLESNERTATVHTSKIQARVDLATGAVVFLDAAGKEILGESPDGRTLEPADVLGEKTLHVRQRWQAAEGESLYGLGQQQLGLMDLKGWDLDLWQHNGTVAVPFLVSSRGYGILWDNPSYTRFGSVHDPVTPPAGQMLGVDGKPGGLTATYFAGEKFNQAVATLTDATIAFEVPSAVDHPNQRINPALPENGNCSIRWEGFLVPDQAGETTLECYSNGGIQVWVDGSLVMNHWRQGWLPWLDVAKMSGSAGEKHRIRIEWSRDDRQPTMRFRWRPPATDHATSLWSEVGDGIDYYFVYGPKLDDVIAGYRRLTGPAPMMPAWTFGLWQSRQRYATAQQSLDVVDGFRKRGIPFDNIVQDWFYWPENAWGSHRFDPARFPDPDGWIKAIHDRHAHLMISVWGKFYPGTDNFQAMHDHGFLYERTVNEKIRDWVGPGYVYAFYDAFNADARKLFWSQIDSALFRRGIDAWWMDATEPDLTRVPTLEGQRTYAHPTALGTGARVLNAYPLLNSEGVYDGQRRSAPDQRVFILTRSGFAGQQHYAAATWSGDTTSTWTALRKQITAGLGFSISGLPYWTQDIGGFAVPPRFSTTRPTAADQEEWRELNTRWLEFGAFTPLFRVHGESPNREMWEFGGDESPAFKAQLKFDRLRYRLLPYVYSVAGAVHRHGYTFMRPLVMDFTDDHAARDARDEFMFGPALLVSPVTEYQARHRSVYLPGNGRWYDFWTGADASGGKILDAPAPYDAIPLYVRAGSIIPIGPEIQYVAEKSADAITLYMYAGASGDFTLYEDDGLSYGYERGAFSEIPIHWEDSSRTLTIGMRHGSFPGMIQQRHFEVVVIDPQHPAGFSFDARGRDISYGGQSVTLPLP